MSTFDARTSGVLEVDSAEALAALRQKVRAGEIRLSNQLKGKLNFAEECLKAQLRSDGLPKGFAQALFTAILWSGLTQKAVAEQVGVKASTIGD